MTVITGLRLQRTAAALALCLSLATSGALLSASPAGAVSAVHLAGGIAGAGAALTVHKNWDRISAKLSKAVDAVAGGDPAKARELERTLEETPGRLGADAFFSLAAIEGGGKKLRAAVEKINRFVGDRRAALAVAKEERAFYDTESRILSSPLPAAPAASRSASRQRTAPRAVPHCPEYGVRDGSCPVDDRAGNNRTDRTMRAVERWQNRPVDEEARVASFARNCWNQEVDRTSPKYEWFKTMMKRREQTGAPMDCRNATPRSTDDDVATSTSGRNGTTAADERYQAALNRSLGGGSEPSADSYRAALDSLDGREEAARREAAQQRELEELERRTRLAAEAQERERRARVAERRRQREAARASQPSYTYEYPGPSFGEMLGQALQGWADNLNRMQRQLEGGTSGPNSDFIEEACWPGTWGPNCEFR